MQSELPLKQTVTIKKPGSPVTMKIEIAPGQKIVTTVPIELRPNVALVHLQAVGDGNLKPVLKLRDVWVKLTDSLPAELGMDIDSRTLRRLGIAGVIETRHPSPNATEINLHSLDAHLEACRDPEYWITKIQWPDGRRITRQQKYEEAL
jgi:hypothetical protein